jgi:hypothetical protein
MSPLLLETSGVPTYHHSIGRAVNVIPFRVGEGNDLINPRLA